MGHTSDDNDYRLIFDLEGVPGYFGDAWNTADSTEADVAKFEEIVAHEIMEELEKKDPILFLKFDRALTFFCSTRILFWRA